MYIAAIDQGTTSTRTILFDRSGAIAAQAQREHRQIYPQPGWVEHDPLEIWQRTLDVIGDALNQVGSNADAVQAIGITNQRETTVLWDLATGQPVHNAIVWQDTRVDERVAKLAADDGHDRFRKQTGLPLTSYFSALKLQWLLDEIPDARARAEAGELAFGTIDSWLIWNLTGGVDGGAHVTDVTNASRTQLLNLRSLQWDPELLGAFRIPAAVLPRILSSSDQFGTAATSDLTGVPICGVLGDQQAALVGQCCFRAGDVKNTYGTGCFLLLNTGQEIVQSSSGLLTTVAYRFGDERACYALEGSIAVAGALVHWLRDQLGLIETAADIETLAGSVQDNGGVYFVPAFSGLYAPYWQAGARGLIIGLTGYANRGHVARAALEATAYQTRDVVRAMIQDAGVTPRELRVDGGMVGNPLLMQFQADILGAPVTIPRIAETTALGAAYAAGLATGFWPDQDTLREQWVAAERIEPRMALREREQLYASWQKAVQRSFRWAD